MTQDNSLIRTQYLKAMGIQLWVRRHLPPTALTPTPAAVNASLSPPPQNTSPEKQMATPEKSTQPEPAEFSTATESTESTKPIESIESTEQSKPSPAKVEKLEPEESTPPSSSQISSTQSPPIPTVVEMPPASLDWDTLRKKVATCTACELHRTRTQTVFGVGNQHTNWLFIGEAPGADEDAQGEPFVGKAGQLLNNMLYAIGLSRETVFIANIIKCRPPENRDPLPEEMTSCQTFLQQQIQLIKPKLIIAVGRVAAQHLLSTTTPISKLRGQVFEYGDEKIPLIATYHPAYLLRRPSEKRQSWRDLQFIQQKMTQLKTE
jgi:uracil-DNA glycosylase family 4